MGRSKTDNFPRETILASFQFQDVEESTWKTSAKYESQQRSYQEVEEQQTRNFLKTNPAFLSDFQHIDTPSNHKMLLFCSSLQLQNER